MAVYWTIDSRKRLITVTAEGEVTRADAEAFLDVLHGAGLVSYRKLFDGSRGTTRMTPEDLMAVGVAIRAGHAEGPVGPLAVVMSKGNAERTSRVLGIMATARRPMRVFEDVEAARRWIEQQEAGEADGP